MLKKLLATVGALIAVILILVITAGIFIMVKVDKAFIASHLSRVLSRQVHIEKIDVSIFSIVSGIEIKNVFISNYKTPEQLAALVGKPVAAGDTFAGMEALHFKIRLLPLLDKQIALKELVLYRPVINITRSKQGILNVDDLIKSKKRSAAEQKGPDQKNPEPLTADDIPVEIAVGEIGIKNGAINYYDGEFDQRFQIYKLTALAYDIRVAPKDLENKDDLKLKVAMGLKTVGAMKTGSVQSFDVTLAAVGKVFPFDRKTRQLEPEVRVHVGFPDGQITGLQLFNAVAALPVLGDYLGQYISFLKGKQAWKGSKTSGVDLRYKTGKAELSDGRLDLKEANLLFRGAFQKDSKALDMTLDMIMKKEINEGVKKGLAKKFDAAIQNPDIKKYAASDKLAVAALQPLLNQDGMIALKFKVGGTTQKPDVKLTQPRLDSLSDVIRKSVGSLAMEAGKTAGKKLIDEGRKKLMDDVQNLFGK